MVENLKDVKTTSLSQKSQKGGNSLIYLRFYSISCWTKMQHQLYNISTHTGESITHGKVVWVVFNCQITNIPLTSLIKPKAKQPRHRTQDVYIHQLVEQLREFWDDYKEDLNIPQHRPALSLAATQLLQVHRDHRRNDPWHKSVPNPNCSQVAPGPRQTSVRFISSCQCRARGVLRNIYQWILSNGRNGLSWCFCRSNLETN